MLDQLESTDLKAILTENGKTIPDHMAFGFSAFSRLKKCISDIINAHSAAIQAYDKAKTELESAEQQITTRKQNLESVTLSLKNARDAFLAELTEAEDKYSVSVQAVRDAQSEATQTIKKAKADKTAKFTELKAIEDSLSKIKTGRDSLKKISTLRTSDLEIAQIILYNCETEIAALDAAEDQYKKVPIYNFGRRSRARADVNKASDDLSQSIDRIIDGYNGIL